MFEFSGKSSLRSDVLRKLLHNIDLTPSNPVLTRPRRRISFYTVRTPMSRSILKPGGSGFNVSSVREHKVVSYSNWFTKVQQIWNHCNSATLQPLDTVTLQSNWVDCHTPFRYAPSSPLNVQPSPLIHVPTTRSTSSSLVDSAASLSNLEHGLVLLLTGFPVLVPKVSDSSRKGYSTQE